MPRYRVQSFAPEPIVVTVIVDVVVIVVVAAVMTRAPSRSTTRLGNGNGNVLGLGDETDGHTIFMSSREISVTWRLLVYPAVSNVPTP